MTANEMLLYLDTISALDQLWQEQDDNGQEDASDETYKEMWNLFLIVSDELEKLTSGKIDKHIAHTMVFRQTEKLREILTKAA